MNDEKQALIAYRLECADEMMGDARSLVTEKRWKSAVNRLYYAVFQAVSALMIQESIRIKSHSGAKAMLELHFIKTGRIEKKWGKFYIDLSDNREESDYGAFVSFVEEDVLPLLPQTQEFIDVIKRLINQ
ncbi:HEPN domain-containing protein [Spirosoma pollinicola]|uniref:HEPN domain-containing protein n=1 Tax=Spirosoma pollinicola TaxID=2057025 RepID=A0A2K8YX93_9BACT|nr:HEPN domain-containing protein [Spirosoma pollinicola]AUD02251.1 HEPN domain-containing protein [Spirosoma pollinicola]